METELFEKFKKAYNNFDPRPLEGESLKNFYVEGLTKDSTHRLARNIEMAEQEEKERD